jgi:outer membrane protein assembly factor BamB
MIYMASWSPGGDTGARLGLSPWPEALRSWDGNKDGVLDRREIGNADVLDRFYRMDLDQDGRLDQAEWDRHGEVFRRAQNAVLALRPDGRGTLTESALVWKYSRGVPYVSTPLVHGGVLWMVKDGGIVTMLDAATGDRLQEERLPGLGNYAASPVTGDGKVYFASVPGVVSVVAAQREWRLLSSHNFRERIFATPVIDRDQFLVRTEQALYAFSSPSVRD